MMSRLFLREVTNRLDLLCLNVRARALSYQTFCPLRIRLASEAAEVWSNARSLRIFKDVTGRRRSVIIFNLRGPQMFAQLRDSHLRLPVIRMRTTDLSMFKEPRSTTLAEEGMRESRRLRSVSRASRTPA